MAWDVPPAPGLPTTPEKSKSWENDTAPVFILGSDGKAHETRPTTSLAHDLAKQEVVVHTSPDRPRRIRNPDDRPLNPANGGYSAGQGSSGSGRRTSLADRPVTGFTQPSGPACRRSLGGAESHAPTPTQAPARRSSIGSVAEAPKRFVRSYEPFEKLLSMGVDKESARAALIAASGDVERAVRLVLEDSQAHVSREACEWEFEGDKGWVPFSAESDARLHAAQAAGKEACELRFGGHRYLIDFNSLTQLNLATQRSRRIRRKGGASSSSGAHEKAAPSRAAGSDAKAKAPETPIEAAAQGAASSEPAKPAKVPVTEAPRPGHERFRPFQRGKGPSASSGSS
ncbi:unnamed protein product [Symbiodinium natans]|uniref:Uncharacterized protein n=1 Tax=Symbiodinium natans TaxID=878477 RepID=A0A812TYC3_9DINO|nr:unnamed protein product [Symbiodinium natans]